MISNGQQAPGVGWLGSISEPGPMKGSRAGGSRSQTGFHRPGMGFLKTEHLLSLPLIVSGRLTGLIFPWRLFWGWQRRPYPIDKQVWEAVPWGCPAPRLQSCLELIPLLFSRDLFPGTVDPVVNETVFGAFIKSRLKDYFLVLISFIWF